MYGIVTIAGQQFKVEEGQEIFVHRLDAKVGDNIEFNDVNLTEVDGNFSIGNPHTGGSVSAEVLDHVKGDKVIVFKKKRRQGYRRKNGHRQQFTKIRINSISA